MESSTAVFLERQSSCELLPTDSEIKTLQKQNLTNTRNPGISEIAKPFGKPLEH
jgi:hypothetical protein